MISFNILKFLRLPGIVFLVLKQLKKQKNFISTHFTPILAYARQHNDGSLSENDFKKITHYYGLAVPAILGEAICILAGKTMTEKERWASSSQGAMTGLFDDFFDKDYLEDAEVKNKIIAPGIELPHQSNERLFDLFYKKALQTVPDKNAMQQTLYAVYEAQVKSKQQVDPMLSADDIKKITFEKGGASLLFYRTAFGPAATEPEITLLHQLGGTMQLANDIFDVYKDKENGIRTLVTETGNIHEIRLLLNTRLLYAYQQAYTLPYPTAAIQKFLSVLSIAIFSRCFVCLDHLQKNETFTNIKFQVNAYSRKQLICDMDTKKNMLRSAAYHLKTIR